VSVVGANCMRLIFYVEIPILSAFFYFHYFVQTMPAFVERHIIIITLYMPFQFLLVYQIKVAAHLQGELIAVEAKPPAKIIAVKSLNTLVL
jgi:hypothetical protein